MDRKLLKKEANAAARETGWLELVACADTAADDWNVDAVDRRELNELKLAAQKEILGQGPIKSETD
jgi:hypothetical protein